MGIDGYDMALPSLSVMRFKPTRECPEGICRTQYKPECVLKRFYCNGKIFMEELIEWEYKGITSRKPMPVEARAGQFAAFAALSGHDEAIDETARLTEASFEKDEEP